MADCDLCGRAEVSLRPVRVPSRWRAYRETGKWRGLCPECLSAAAKLGPPEAVRRGHCGLCGERRDPLLPVSLRVPAVAGPQPGRAMLCEGCAEACQHPASMDEPPHVAAAPPAAPAGPPPAAHPPSGPHAVPAAGDATPGRGYAILHRWLTTTDHKEIGVLYIVTAFLFFVLAGILALAMRTQLARPDNDFLGPGAFNQFFTVHGLVMLLWWIIPVSVGGFGNYFLPLHLGARDVAFPRVNALSYWLYLASGIVLLSSMATPNPPATGWTVYAPLSGPTYSPGAGVDLALLSLTILGTSSILGAVNFLVTIFRMRAPGVSLFRMSLFSWSILVTVTMVLFATPVLAGVLSMLLIERTFGTLFFAASQGGRPILWQHLFWFYSHPAVYIMVLPAMGIISEVIPVFSRRPIYGYKSMAIAMAAIGGIGFMVWTHHMFTTGADPRIRYGMMLTTMVISVPTGIKIFNWLATLWGGSIRFQTPMLFALSFIAMFTIGGITGIYNASIPVDYHLHDTYWVVAHLHYVLFGGAVMGVFAGTYYWFPKMTGRLYHEAAGKVHFLLTFIGFNLAFFPMHTLGLMGMPRRISTYTPETGWGPLNYMSTVGSMLLGLSQLILFANLIHAHRHGARAGDDPWKGSTFEWTTTSPPPKENFHQTPVLVVDHTRAPKGPVNGRPG